MLSCRIKGRAKTYLVEEVISIEGMNNFVQVLVLHMETFNDIVLDADSQSVLRICATAHSTK